VHLGNNGKTKGEGGRIAFRGDVDPEEGQPPLFAPSPSCSCGSAQHVEVVQPVLHELLAVDVPPFPGSVGPREGSQD
jgi:hypothetical protein